AISTLGNLDLTSGAWIGADATHPLRIQMTASKALTVDAAGVANIQQVADDLTFDSKSNPISSLLVSRVNAADVSIEVVEGDMTVGQITSDTGTKLTAAQSILDYFNDIDAPIANINGIDANLKAGAKIGASDNFFDLNITGNLTS